jgi:hypothetical protein
MHEQVYVLEIVLRQRGRGKFAWRILGERRAVAAAPPNRATGDGYRASRRDRENCRASSSDAHIA